MFGSRRGNPGDTDAPPRMMQGIPKDDGRIAQMAEKLTRIDARITLIETSLGEANRKLDKVVSLTSTIVMGASSPSGMLMTKKK